MVQKFKHQKKRWGTCYMFLIGTGVWFKYAGPPPFKTSDLKQEEEESGDTANRRVQMLHFYSEFSGDELGSSC